MSQWDNELRDYRELSNELFGTDDLFVVCNEVAKRTGWAADKVLRWSGEELNDAMRVLLGKRPTDNARKLRALALWNDGLTWGEVATIVNGSVESERAVMVEMKRFAKENGLYIRTGKPGRLKSD